MLAGTLCSLPWVAWLLCAAVRVQPWGGEVRFPLWPDPDCRVLGGRGDFVVPLGGRFACPSPPSEKVRRLISCSSCLKQSVFGLILYFN